MPVPRFWREIPARYNMIGTQCGNCQRKFFPPRTICPDCHRKSVGMMKETTFPEIGEVISFSIVHHAPEAFTLQVPYPIAIIELEDGVRITGQIIDCDTGKVAIGMKVRTVFRKIGFDGQSGIIYYGYKFAPA